MSKLQVPGTGIFAYGAPDQELATSPHGSRSTQVMQLELPPPILAEMIRVTRQSKNPTNISVQFGREKCLRYGTKVRNLTSTTEKYRHELYSMSNSKPNSGLSFSGILSHKLEVIAPRKNDEVDPDVLQLQSKIAAMEQEKQAKSSIYVKDSSSLPPARQIKAHEVKRVSGSVFGNKKRSSALLPPSTRSMPSSMPGSPSMNATRSPSLMPQAPTSMPVFTSLQTPKLQALRTPLIHLLAVRPITIKELVKKTRGSTEDCKLLIEKVGKEARTGDGWVLTDRTYKELDVWKFPYPSEADRQLAIENAISAFDRLRIGTSEKLWQLLLPKQERFKGKILSKLGTKKPPPPTPKIADLFEEEDSENMAMSKAMVGGEKMTRSVSQQPITKKKVSEKEAQSKRLLSKNPPKPKATGKTTEKKIAKTSNKKAEASALSKKIKSAEFVTDTDEEDGLEDLMPSKSSSQGGKATTNGSITLASTKAPKVQENSKKVTLKIAKNGAKSKTLPAAASTSVGPKDDAQPAKASDKSNKATSASITASPKPAKAPVPSTKSSPQKLSKAPVKQPAKSLQRDTIASPRKLDNSPKKPSPLGSSPPENASDFEALPSVKSSPSSPLSSQVSKGQSTPTPAPTKNADKRASAQTASAQKINKIKAPRPSHPLPPKPMPKESLKRKADDTDRDETTKSTVYHPRRQEESNKRRQIEAASPSISISDSSSADSPKLSYHTMDKAKRFKEIYGRYLALHKELEASPSPDQKKLKQLHLMHQKLSEMKLDLTRAAFTD